MKSIGKKQYKHLFSIAEQSSRKRTHLNLHSSFEERVQRLLISLTKGSFVEPHYHSQKHQWEMFIVLDGLVKVTLYQPNGEVMEVVYAGVNEEVNIIEFEPGEIHSVECVSQIALMMEIKEGPFLPEYAKVQAPFLE